MKPVFESGWNRKQHIYYNYQMNNHYNLALHYNLDLNSDNIIQISLLLSFLGLFVFFKIVGLLMFRANGGPSTKLRRYICSVQKWLYNQAIMVFTSNFVNFTIDNFITSQLYKKYPFWHKLFYAVFLFMFALMVVDQIFEIILYILGFKYFNYKLD